MRVALLFSLSACAALACGEDEGPPAYTGQPGRAVPMQLSKWVPVLSATVEARPPGVPVLVDTGAPLTILSPRAHAVPPGRAAFSLGVFGLTFEGLEGAVATLFAEDSPCAEALPQGLVGGDLLRWFRVGLDYQGGRAFLFDGAGPDPALAAGLASSVEVEVEVLGGERYALLPGTTDQIPIPATRVVVSDAQVEGTARTALIDTGASLPLLRRSLYQTLSAAGRPTLCCESVATLAGTLQGRLVRLKELRLGAASVKNVPVLVFESASRDSEFFGALSDEVGREVHLLVGGTFLRQFAVHLDYPARKLTLSRYAAPSHVPADEHVGPGFSFCKAKKAENGMVVVDVFQGTDAAARGVKSGEYLTAVDGQAVQGLSAQETRALLLKHAVGATARLTFFTSLGTRTRDVVVERLLPDYP